ncbi:Endonuclease/exonuclease/phosphatase superfamily [Sesbania bispinosa]|nr:Endonuclease/exonuclease/phosphatase superfamily [Sesbania bispinosa]
MEKFREFVDEAGLMDFDLKGSSFTWFSNPRQGVIIKEKIDRVLANSICRTTFPHAYAMDFPAISFDHSPILFDVEPDESSGQQFKTRLCGMSMRVAKRL